MSGQSTYKPKSAGAKWLEKRLPILGLVHSSFVVFPNPRNLNYWWTFGGILAFCLVVQILTGIILAMHYTPHVDFAFESVEHIMRNVNYGWLLRYIHSNGAAMFFVAVYIHIFRGLYYGSYKAPREVLWILGMVIYLLVSLQAGKVLHVMSKAGILRLVLPGAGPFAGFNRLCKLEDVLKRKPDAMLRIAVLYGGPVPVEQIEVRVELSRKERELLVKLNDVAAMPGDIEQARRALYRLKPILYQQVILLCWAKARSGESHDAWDALYHLPDVWPVPKFPLKGADVVARGVTAGPRVGIVLRAIEDKWIAAGFPDQTDYFKDALDDAIAAL